MPAKTQVETMLSLKSLLLAGVALRACAPAALKLSLTALLFSQSVAPHLRAQPASTNRVLELDGNGSYLELPPRIFDALDEATIEAWIRFRSLNDGPLRLFSYGARNADLGIQESESLGNGALNYFIVDPQQRVQNLTAPGLIQLGDWCHIAAVSGRSGMKLYFNGLEAGSNSYAGSFSAIKNGAGFRLGGSVVEGESSVNGQLDEVRVCNAARTQEQIMENMYQELAGREAGLVAYWNFDDPANPGRDVSGGHHGKLVGNAKITQTDRPRAPTPLQLESVLDLDGKDSFVELPPHMLDDLDAATIEVWVQFRELNQRWSRFISYGAYGADMGIQEMGSGGLYYFIVDRELGIRGLPVPDVVRPGEWAHIAAVSGKGGMKLYFNGIEAGSNDYPGSFSAIKNGATFRIGRSVVDQEPFVNGILDEVRVWKVARTAEQIRANVFAKLTGQEDGLIACWNFDNPSNPVRDLAPGGHSGKLMGSAKLSKVRGYAPAASAFPGWVVGRVTDQAGRSVRDAEVKAFQEGKEIASVKANIAGEYRLFLRSLTDAPCEIQVNRYDLSAVQTGLGFSNGEKKTLDFTLKETSVVGAVVTAQGRPRVGAKVEFVRENDGRVEARTLTNAKGEYRFKGLHAGRYRVRAAGPNGPVDFARDRVLDVASGRTYTGIEITVPPRMEVAPFEPLPNRTLQLDGKGGYVELPSNLFNDLEEATLARLSQLTVEMLNFRHCEDSNP